MHQLLDNFSISDWALQFSFVALLLITFYLVGYLFIGRNDKITVQSQQLFFRLLLGLTTCISIYAVISCEGRSICLLSILLLGLIRFQKKETIPAQITTSTSEIKNDFSTILFLALLFSFKSCIFYFYQSLFPDYSFYVRISHFIRVTGQENEFHIYNIYSSKYHGITSYHYFETWLNAFVEFYFKEFQSGLKNYLCVTTTILNVILACGVFSILKTLNKSFRFFPILLISVLITTLGGINISEFFHINVLHDFDHVFASTIAYNEGKFCAPIIFLCAIILKFLNNKPEQGMLFAALLPVLNFIIGPALLFSISSIVFYLLLQRKKYDLKTIPTLVNYGIFVVITIGILAIYNSRFGSYVSRDSVKLSDAVKDIIAHSDNLFLMMKITGASVLAIFYFLILWFLPVLIFSESRKKLFMFSKEEILIGGFYILLTLGGAIFWALLHNTLNSVQLFSITVRSYVLIFTIFIMAKFKDELFSNKKLQISYLILICATYFTTSQTIKDHIHLTTTNCSSDSFIRAVIKIINSNENQKTAFVRNSKDYADPFACYPNFSIPLPEITRYSNTITPISLSEIDTFPCAEERCRKGLQLGLFYNYVYPNRVFSQKSKAEINVYKCSFLIENDIHYLLRTGKAEIPESSKIKTSLLLTDQKTGFELYRLDFTTNRTR